jgi:hypothetical protein
MDAELAKGDQGIAAALVHLTIQPFIKGLCDLHGVSFHPYLSQQFSILYNLYLMICEGVQQCVNAALRCDATNYCLRHSCPAFTYKLQDEGNLILKMLVTMDGNDSLKCILQQDPPATSGEGEPEPKEPQVGESHEHPDLRSVGGDYLISREKVKQWAKAVLKEILSMPPESVSLALQCMINVY